MKLGSRSNSREEGMLTFRIRHPNIDCSFMGASVLCSRSVGTNSFPTHNATILKQAPKEVAEE
jgi:hypothetical protein